MCVREQCFGKVREGRRRGGNIVKSRTIARSLGSKRSGGYCAAETPRPRRCNQRPPVFTSDTKKDEQEEKAHTHNNHHILATSKGERRGSFRQRDLRDVRKEGERRWKRVLADGDDLCAAFLLGTVGRKNPRVIKEQRAPCTCCQSAWFRHP